ncbi:MAG TPA: hypothetical protein VF159_08940 [Gemmatimonadaceae bacterium]
MTESRTTVLILATDAATEADVGMLVRAAGCVSLFPREEEGGHAALFRLRPMVVMLQAGREEVTSERFHAIAKALDSGVVLFGDESPELRESARVHGFRSVALSAPARAFGFAIEEAAGA